MDNQADYQIQFVPDPVCWTEVPSDVRSLGRQRARRQKGLLDVLWPNKDMLFRPRYGRIGSVALPYLWVFELLAPVIELGGIATIVLAAWLGILSHEFFLRFLFFGYAFPTVISIGSVLQEELTYKRYNDWQEVARLVSHCFLEHFPYRQLHMVWRLQGLWQYLLHVCGLGLAIRVTPATPRNNPLEHALILPISMTVYASATLHRGFRVPRLHDNRRRSERCLGTCLQ